MIDKPTVDWLALSPTLALLAATALALMVGVLPPERTRKAVSALVCALGFVGTGIAAAFVFAKSGDPTGAVANAVVRDRFGALAQILIAGAGLLAVGVSAGEVAARPRAIESGERGRGERQWAEYFALLAAAGAGMAFFVTANNLMTLFLGLEWFSISLYILCAIDTRVAGSLEAGLKYLIIGSFGSAVLLFGSALVYGATGALELNGIREAVSTQGLSDDALLLVGLAMLIAGLAFKASAAPFHMWTPDVYEGAPTPVTAFMAAATKIAALVVTLRILTVAFPQEEHLWTVAVAVIACASLAVGNLAALVQRNVKRILAYSSVSHAGFLLIGVAAASELGTKALLYYLIPYAAMSLGSFAVVAARERELDRAVTLDDLAGMGWERPFLGLAMAVFMFGSIGLPPAGLFLGKFYVFAAAYEHGWTWLVIVGVAATAVSVYYYLGVIRALYMRSGAELQLLPAGGSPPRELLLQASVAASLAVTIGSFFAVQPLIDLAEKAAAALPF